MAATWYLGPLGHLRALPSPDGGVQESVVRYGGIHQGLSGARTVDVTGHRGSYSFDFKNLDPSEVAWLESLNLRMIPGPYRLIDPRKKNRLSHQSSVGKVWDYATSLGLYVSNLIYTVSTDWPAWLPIKGRSFETTSAGSGAKFGRFDSAPHLTTVFPGETVTASIHARSVSTSVQLQLTIDYFDELGAQVGSGNAPSLATLNTSWNRYLVTTTVPAGVAAVRFAFIVSGTYNPFRMAAPQLETGPFATDWEMGGGAPVVHLDQVTFDSSIHTLRNGSITLLEA